VQAHINKFHMIVDQWININRQDSNENLAFTLLKIMPLSFHVPWLFHLVPILMNCLWISMWKIVVRKVVV
jgi:hypothetical protein